MKKIQLIILLFCAVNAGAQQNLVPNHSFEIADTCPRPVYSPANYAKDWFDVRNTPDYFNICDTSGGFYTPPNTSFGYQCPANGKAFMGIYTFNDPAGNPGAQEIFGVKLFDSLMQGNKYFLSLKVVHANSYCKYTTAKVGVKFFKNKPINIPTSVSANDTYINNQSTFFTNIKISDTLNWQTIKGNFIADSNYKYMAIGNFFDYQNSDTTNYFTNFGAKCTYYFIDDICVSSDSNVCNIQTQTNCITLTDLKSKDEKSLLKIFPNPAHDKIEIQGIELNEYNISLFNSLGLKIHETKNEKNIDISKLLNGIYYLKVKSIKDERQVKIIINN